MMMLAQWVLLICICCELKKKRHVEIPQKPQPVEQSSLDISDITLTVSGRKSDVEPDSSREIRSGRSFINE